MIYRKRDNEIYSLRILEIDEKTQKKTVDMFLDDLIEALKDLKK
jgi:hypothetical protein